MRLRLIDKRVVDFLFELIELFPSCYGRRYERISSRCSRTVFLRQLNVLHWCIGKRVDFLLVLIEPFRSVSRLKRYEQK